MGIHHRAVDWLLPSTKRRPSLLLLGRLEKGRAGWVGQGVHRHRTPARGREARGIGWCNARKASARDEALAAPTRLGCPTIAIRSKSNVRRSWRESSKRSSAPGGWALPPVALRKRAARRVRRSAAAKAITRATRGVTIGVIQMSPYVARNIWRPMLRSELCCVWFRAGRTSACLRAERARWEGVDSDRGVVSATYFRLVWRRNYRGATRRTSRLTRRGCTSRQAQNSSDASSIAVAAESRSPPLPPSAALLAFLESLQPAQNMLRRQVPAPCAGAHIRLSAT